MTSTEKEMIKTLPAAMKPIGAWTYFIYSVIFTIPVVGFIVWLITAIGAKNVNLRSFARSYCCVYILALILIVVLAVSGIGVSIIDGISNAVV